MDGHSVECRHYMEGSDIFLFLMSILKGYFSKTRANIKKDNSDIHISLQFLKNEMKYICLSNPAWIKSKQKQNKTRVTPPWKQSGGEISALTTCQWHMSDRKTGT